MGTEFGDDSVSSVSMLEKLADTVSVVTDRTQAASVLLPEGMTEQQAVEVYQQYNFRHEYDANLSITKYREDVSSGILNRFVQDLLIYALSYITLLTSIQLLMISCHASQFR